MEASGTSSPVGARDTQPARLEDAMDMVPSGTFLRSKPSRGQEKVLITYAVPKDGSAPYPSGYVPYRAIVKVIGTFPSDHDAEIAARREFSKGTLKVVKILDTGSWAWIRDPRNMDKATFDTLTNGEIKRCIASQNKDLEDEEKREQQELKEYQEKMKAQERALENPETVEYYTILRLRIDAIPGHIMQHKREIERITKEIERLSSLLPKLEDEAKILESKHPEYPSMMAETVRKLRADE